MTNQLQINEQVIIRQRLAGGLKKVLLGTVLAFKDDGQTAVVSLPAERVRRDIPVDQLEPVRQRYSRARVNLDPVRRGIGTVR